MTPTADFHKKHRTSRYLNNVITDVDMTIPVTPRVAVVIPARNEAGAIGACLRSVEQQSRQPDEIILVDGESDDGTAAAVEEFRKKSSITIQVLRNSQRIIPAALNLAVGSTDCDVIVRVDAHTTISPNYIETILHHLSEGRYAGVGGSKRAVATSLFGRAAATAFQLPLVAGTATYHHETRPHVCDHVAFGAYPKAVIDCVGGWDDSLTVNQDFEFDYRIRRAGGQLLCDPAMIVYWRSRETVVGLFLQYRRYGWGKIRVWRKHRAAIKLPQMVPLGFVLYALATPFLATRFGRSAVVPLAAHPVVMLATASACRNSSTRTTDLVLVPPAALVMHLGFGLGMLEGLLRWITASDRDGSSPRDLFTGNPSTPRHS